MLGVGVQRLPLSARRTSGRKSGSAGDPARGHRPRGQDPPGGVRGIEVLASGPPPPRQGGIQTRPREDWSSQTPASGAFA